MVSRSDMAEVVKTGQGSAKVVLDALRHNYFQKGNPMLSLALPKGSLEEQTYKLFDAANLKLSKPERGYSPTIDDPRVGKVKILRPQEIPVYVTSGDFDLGISGHDWVMESKADVVELAELPYSKTGTGAVKMVLAVSDTS